MSKLINAVKGIGEYFLGTSTHAFYNEQRDFYRKQAELAKDMKVYDDSEKKLNQTEVRDIITGKITPNVITFLGGTMFGRSLLYLFQEHNYTPSYTDRDIFGMLAGSGMIIASEITRNLYKNVIKTNKSRAKIEKAKFIDNLESKTDSIKQQ